EEQVNLPSQRDYIGQVMDDNLPDELKISQFVVICKQAAIVRLYLSLKLARRNPPPQIENLEKVRRLLQNADELECFADELQSYVEVLQDEVDGEDYVIGFLERNKNYAVPVSEVTHIVGERWFLYEALGDISNGNREPRLLRGEKNLFYFYLRVQLELRDKVVQTNDKVGFDNFQDFNHRRLYFLPSAQGAARMAVREPLQTMPHLLELEA